MCMLPALVEMPAQGGIHLSNPQPPSASSKLVVNKLARSPSAFHLGPQQKGRNSEKPKP